MNWLTKEEYKSREKKQTFHRTLNTFLMGCVVVLGVMFVEDKVTPLYEDISGITETRIERQEIGQILKDEGLRRCQYKDTLGHSTIGVGHLVLDKDFMQECINEEQIIDLLIKDYRYAKSNVEKRYPWAEGEVKLILINMTFQLGENRLAKFKNMLSSLEEGDYRRATIELLDSSLHRQTPKRIERHAARILSLSDNL